MRGAAKKAASEELERRSQYLSSLVQRTKIMGDNAAAAADHDKKEEEMNVKVRAADMSPALQKHAFRCARETLTSMPKLESKRLALALKKARPCPSMPSFPLQEFDSTYGPAWHCIVGTSFGSYVTHSLGGFLYFSIDKVYILLFRTAVEPVDR
ncbi:dynein light chain [Musa troglodytarum]|uniref:Dynein light chain n=1 Tax=Musa troglodytarum TaxID=320322 RepID=A0A9E7HHA1_9LILI|nr:dynein light chain [Musa troglodytarum]